MTPIDLLVVGAGPAGLCAGWHGQQLGWHTVVIEASDHPGGAWAAMPETTRCLSPRRFDRLPDGTIPPGVTDRAFAGEVASGLAEFAKNLEDLQFGVRATGLRSGRPLTVETTDGPRVANRVIVATGEYSRPKTPALAGRFDGVTLHSSELHRSAVAARGHVVVIGAGNSGAEVALTLATRGVSVTVSGGLGMRDPGPAPSRFREQVQWVLSATPITGLPLNGGCREQTPLVDRDLYLAVRRGKIRVVDRAIALDRAGVRIRGGELIRCDTVVFATGFRRATAWLSPSVTCSPTGHPVAVNGLSPEVHGLGFVGIPCMRTRRSGFLRGFSDDAQAVVGALR
ncbi:MAG: putative flavoprotein involved in K+ transport [Myxococcota bacterium]|jgi:putative flavoprotein involved in K+ transport